MGRRWRGGWEHSAGTNLRIHKIIRKPFRVAAAPAWCSRAAGWLGWGTQLSATSPASLGHDTEPWGKQDGLLLHRKELSALVSPLHKLHQLPGRTHHAEQEALINRAIKTGTFYARSSQNKLHFWSQPTLTHWIRDSLSWLFFGCPLSRGSFRHIPSNVSLRAVGR